MGMNLYLGYEVLHLTIYNYKNIIIATLFKEYIYNTSCDIVELSNFKSGSNNFELVTPCNCITPFNVTVPLFFFLFLLLLLLLEEEPDEEDDVFD
jgi:hypothetical protein